MTKQDGNGNLYKLVERPKANPKSGMVAVRYNNGPEIHIPRQDFDSYKEVADSSVEQGELL